LVADTKDGMIDAVSFFLRYPGKLLNPLALDHSTIDEFVKEEVEYAFDPDEGELFFRARLKEPRKFPSQPVASIIWEALKPTDGAAVKFAWDKRLPTGLYLRGLNVLGTSNDSADGVINASVMVRDPKVKPLVASPDDKVLLIGTDKIKPPPPCMDLTLKTSSRSVREGEVLTVGLQLANDTGARFDRVRVSLQFNPHDLEVVDWDRHNWIRTGVNIYDGFAREDFPFDFFKHNEVDNEHGTIIYEAATASPMRAAGTFAKIRFRAKRSVEETTIRLLRDDVSRSLSTDVTYLGHSMLRSATPDVPGELLKVAVHRAPARIRPLLQSAPAREEGIVIGGRGKLLTTN
jgi:hypothetical protein